MTVDAPPAFRGHTFDVTNPRGRFREVADSAGRRQRFGLVGADFRRRLPLLDRFQTIVDATHTGILTPDPRAYGGSSTDFHSSRAPACSWTIGATSRARRKCGLQTVHFDVRNPLGPYTQALRYLDLALT